MRPSLREKRSPYGKAFYRLLTALSLVLALTRGLSVLRTLRAVTQPALQNGLSLHKIVQMTLATASDHLIICCVVRGRDTR